MARSALIGRMLALAPRALALIEQRAAHSPAWWIRLLALCVRACRRRAQSKEGSQ